MNIGADIFGGETRHIYPPTTLLVKGEKISLEEENAMFGGTAGRAWTEYARGREGEYPTFDDAPIVKQHIEALKRSVKAGKRIVVSDM